MTGRARPRRTVALAAAVIFAAGGVSAVGWSLTHQQHAPQPDAAAAGSLSGSPASAQPAGGSTAGPAKTGVILPRSIPVSLRIPAIGVTSRVNPLGLGADGTVEVPAPGPRYNQAAWFSGSPTPGQQGPAVVEGHVDSVSQGPSVFYRLGALRPGDRVLITRADHRIAVFTVNAVRRYPKDAFPTALVYGNTSNAQLRLITCGGSFDSSTGHYRDNIVAFAHLTSVAPG
jgi:hypothetical protein